MASDTYLSPRCGKGYTDVTYRCPRWLREILFCTATVPKYNVCLYDLCYIHIWIVHWCICARAFYDRFHWKCHTPEIHQIQKFKFPGTSSSETNVSIWFVPRDTEKSEVQDLVEFGDVAILVETVIREILFGTVTVAIYNVIWCNVYWIHIHCVWMYLCHHFTIGHTVFYCNSTCIYCDLMQIVLYIYEWYCAITLLWERMFCTVTVPMNKVFFSFHAICIVYIYIVYGCTCATTLLFLANSTMPSLYHFWRYDWVQSRWR